MQLSVIGLGKLGLCVAACLTAKGHQVWCFDKNEQSMAALRQRRCPIEETGLAQLLERGWDNLHPAADTGQAVANSQLTFMVVPTPSKPDGGFDNRFVEAVLTEMAPALRAKPDFHVVDVVSTVMPGSSEGVFKPLMERLTGKVCGRDFGLVYNPEFIALGTVIRDFLNPDLVLIGASDQASGELVRQAYLSTCDNQPQVALMSLVNAEITKLSLNCYVTMKVSFANELAAICERVPGADVDVVTQAIGQDRRVGSLYLRGGLGFGGPCFPRDNRAFQFFAAQHGWQALLGPQVVAVNQTVVQRLQRQVSLEVPLGEKVAILGLSYKPGTHIVEESQSLALAASLVREGYRVAVYDPCALAMARQELGESVTYHADPYECAEGAAALALMTNWPELAVLDWSRLTSLTQPQALLLDAWRTLKGQPHAGLRYRGLGLGALPEPVMASPAQTSLGPILGEARL